MGKDSDRSGTTAGASGALVSGADDATVARSEAAPDRREIRDRLQMMSHDIKTHLNVILGFVGILRDAALDGADARDALDRIESNACEAASLAVNFLRAEEIDSRGLTLHATESSLDELLGEVVRDLEPRARLRGIEVRLDADPRIPALPIDAAMLGRALANLIDNAIQHSRGGQTVDVESRYRDDGATIAVRDRGDGIPAEQIPHLFERFARGANASHSASTGLGLYIVAKVVALHGGSIEVTQPEDGGTRFTIFFPRRRE